MPWDANRATIELMGRTVLVVDDNAEFRSVARTLLEAGGFSVVGDVGDGESALAAADQLNPDVVVLDVQLPDLSGFAVAERLVAERSPRPVVVLVSSRSSSSYIRRLALSPAVGFLSKSDFSSTALAALLPAVSDAGGG